MLQAEGVKQLNLRANCSGIKSMPHVYLSTGTGVVKWVSVGTFASWFGRCICLKLISFLGV